MIDHRPLFRRIIDAIHALQRKTATIEERCAASERPALPDAVSPTPRHGSLVSPRHALFLMHHPIAVGDVLRFGGEERRVESTSRVRLDLGVAEWRMPVRAQPFAIPPWNWEHKLPFTRDLTRLRRPLVAWRVNRNHEILRTPISMIHAGGVSWGNDVEGPILAGDSGGAVWLALDRPVLISLVGTGSGGSSIPHTWREITEATRSSLQEAEW